MDYNENTQISVEERRRRRIEQRKKELKAARIKFGIACAVVLLALILIIVGCTKGCTKNEVPETTVSTTEEVTTEATDPAPVFTYKASDWKLILVDAEHPIAEDYNVQLTTLKSKAKVNSQLMDDLQDMMDDCRAAGHDPIVISAYVSYADQEKNFDKRVSELMAIGYLKDRAETEALKTVSRPGTSEYQTGLALDIVSESCKEKDAEALAGNETLQWLYENSWKYGFVLRYTADQAARIGVTYEPWHFRYVGKDAAKDMFEQDYCLEELLVLLEEPE